MKTSELKRGNVVCYKGNRFPYGDMTVIYISKGGVYLRRPYITEDKPDSEELYFPNDSNMDFELLREK